MGIRIGSVIEWNVEHNYKGYFTGKDSKYSELHKIFDKLNTCDGDDNKGWVKVSFDNEHDARRAQTAISQYCRRKYAKAPWRQQTSFSVEDGTPFLYLRKVKI